MKKVLLAFLLAIILPLNVYAFEIKGVIVDIPTEVKVGSEIAIEIEVQFNNMNKSDPNEMGYAGAIVEVDYDKSALSFKGFSSSSWENKKEGSLTGDFYSSTATESMLEKDSCENGLYCESYKIKIIYTVNTTDKTDFSYTFKNLYFITLRGEPKDYDEKEPTEDDTLTYRVPTDKTYNIKIIKESSDIPTDSDKQETIKPNTPITTNKPPVTTKPSITTPNKTQPSTAPSTTPSTPDKSSIKYLKSLSIEGYDIDFAKDKTLYTIDIAKDVSTLDVKVELEDEKASYVIKGADDLSSHYDMVEIVITAENGERKIYTIKAKREEEKADEEYKFFDFEIDKKYIRYGVIALGSILGITIVVVIFIKIRDRKINKAFKDMDKL